MAKKHGPHKPKPKPPRVPRHNIKNWRIYRLMTVEQLAEATGMSTGNISALENGRQGYSEVGLKTLADALRATPAQLLEVNPLLDAETQQFWPLWEKASPNDRETLIIMAKRLIGGA
jgi:transcriptional regulator with XRE-family HTH domain